MKIMGFQFFSDVKKPPGFRMVFQRGEAAAPPRARRAGRHGQAMPAG